MAWHCLGIRNISLWGSDGMNEKSGGIYSLRDSNVQDVARAPGGGEKGHRDEGRDLGDEEMDLYDKTLDLKIGL